MRAKLVYESLNKYMTYDYSVYAINENVNLYLDGNISLFEFDKRSSIELAEINEGFGDIGKKIIDWSLKTLGGVIDKISKIKDMSFKMMYKLMSLIKSILSKIKKFEQKHPMLFKFLIIGVVAMTFMVLNATGAQASTGVGGPLVDGAATAAGEEAADVLAILGEQLQNFQETELVDQIATEMAQMKQKLGSGNANDIFDAIKNEEFVSEEVKKEVIELIKTNYVNIKTKLAENPLEYSKELTSGGKYLAGKFIDAMN